MKKVLSSIILVVVLLSCSVPKKAQVTNSYKYKGIVFYTKTSPFLEFYPTEKKLNKRQVVYLLDNTYGNRVWFSKTKYMFGVEDMVIQFDSIMIALNGRPYMERYTYVTAKFNQPIETALRDSVFRSKPYKYLDLSFDQFIIDDRDLKIDTLIFARNKLDRQYHRLLKLHEGSIKSFHPYPSSPPK